MGLVRHCQSSIVFLTLAFSLVALGILPTALCCEAMAGGSVEVCPHMGSHGEGEACPMHQPANSRDRENGSLTLQACSTGDPLLAGLLTLTGAMPETAQFRVAELVARPLMPTPSASVDLFERQPHAPPPRV